MIFPALSWVLLLLSAALCAVGFYKFTYFTTVGHGLTVAGLGLTSLIIALGQGKSSTVLLLTTLLCIVYGLFQGIFTVLGELVSTSHRQVLKSEAEGNTPLYVSLCLWLGMSILSFLPITPLWYRAAAGVGKDTIFSWIGLVIMASGIWTMLAAHRQANRWRKQESPLPPMEGLYNWARCPSHMGRIVFWLGMLISGVGYVAGSQWLMVLMGTAFAIFLALRSAFRQDAILRKKYGFLPEYREYVEDTHILIPLLMSKKGIWDREEETKESEES